MEDSGLVASVTVMTIEKRYHVMGRMSAMVAYGRWSHGGRDPADNGKYRDVNVLMVTKMITVGAQVTECNGGEQCGIVSPLVILVAGELTYLLVIYGNMAPSTSTVGPIPTQPQLKQEKKEPVTTVGVSAKWGIIMTLLNLVYGHLLVATQLPPDPRQDSWLLMKSPLPTYFLSLGYVIGVTWLGPKFMENRKPISGLRPVMVAYNTFQVVYSSWLVYETCLGGWFTNYSFRCQICDFSNDPQAIRMLHASYWYYFSKFVDFFDTVFFVLNKKHEHISLLHVVHHSLMPVSMWYGVRYQPGGHSTFMGLLNSFVHVVMYLYYLLAAMGPRVRPFLWWKKYLTSLQMVQFVAVMLHAVQEKEQSSVSIARESRGVRGGTLSGVSRRGVPNGVAEAACKTMEMCENMALRSRLGAL
ncbi:Elongation of very long chain fatty acids protein-like 6 [Homarus americanus]|uniref:Elongation of very long chain fatty acids protein n=1 Tax=Homarus americanus TaxID=6706 RepID=A0A8J5N3W9_HOMAM|nr:Elongation of very long chain fatty acids protein-like 6 [Homarus americanus]